MVAALGQAGLEKPLEDGADVGLDADADADGSAADRDAEDVTDPEADDGDVVLVDVLRDGDAAIVEP